MRPLPDRRYEYEGWLFEAKLGEDPWPLTRQGKPRKRAGKQFYDMLERFEKEPDQEQFCADIRVAHITRGPDGYRICDKGSVPGPKTKVYAGIAEALRAAASARNPYTHAYGSGTFWGEGVRNITGWKKK
jgi:hypothetical protein